MGNNSFRSKADLVIVWIRENNAVFTTIIITPILNSSKLKEPWVIAMINPKNKKIQNNI